MGEVKIEKKVDGTLRDEWYEIYFSDQMKANKKRNPGLKRCQTRPQTPERMSKDREETDARIRKKKKPKWGPPMRESMEG